MIILTRLNGREMAVNPDLIERAESTPDTVITLSDGTKLLVTESLLELVTRIRHWRSSIAAEAYQLARLQDLTGDPATGPVQRDPDQDISSDEVTAHTLLAPPLAQVLRLTRREH